jgi:glyoxylase I family protein
MAQSFITKVHHIAVICSDYQQSKKFYVDALQMEVVSEEYRATRDSWKLMLRFPDGVQVELFSFPNSPARLSYPEALGLRHLALQVADLDSALSHIRASGVDCEDVRLDELTGARFVFFADPDGLPIELYEIR